MARSFWVNTNKSQAISSAIRDIEKFQDKTQRNIKDAIADSTRAVKDAAVSRVRVHSGKLKKSIGMKLSEKETTGFVSANAPHAHLVEIGAAAALVMPKNKKAIKIGDRLVHHAIVPERKAKPFMRPAADSEKANLEKRIVEAIKDERH